jgi:hypothetical protein
MQIKSGLSAPHVVREEARRTLLREYDKWAKDHPDDITKRSGVVFFTYLQKERLDLLDFHALAATSGRPSTAGFILQVG